MKKQFLGDVTSSVKMENIPSELIINWDQTGIKIIQCHHGLWIDKTQEE